MEEKNIINADDENFNQKQILQPKKTFNYINLMLFIMTIILLGANIILITIFTVFAMTNKLDYNTLLSNPTVLALISILSTSVIAIPVTILLLKSIPSEKYEKTKLKFSDLFMYFLMCIPIVYIGNFIGNILSSIFSSGNAENPLNTMLSEFNILMFIYSIILAPIMEELIFRKVLLDKCTKYGEKTAVIFSGIVFGLFHMNLFQFFYAFGLGMLFAFVYIRTKNIVYPIILHFLVNLIGGGIPMILYTFIDESVFEKLMNMSESTNITSLLTQTQIIALVFLIVFYFVIFVLFIVGLVLLILKLVKKKTFVFFNTTDELRKGEVFKTVYLNVGFILFLLVTVGLSISSLLSANLQ